MVTFLDPFGFKDTIMDLVAKYIGKKRSIIFNLMVRDIHRYGTVSENRQETDELFGNDEWRRDVHKGSFNKLSQARKMEKYATCYENRTW